MNRKERRGKILIVEDDQAIVDLINLHLTDEGYETSVTSDGAEAISRAASGDIDLVILDIMLPGMDGLSICRHLRGDNSQVPILMLTARSAEMDKVVGLEVGADDYITKPFSVRELVARVRALLRRAGTEHSGYIHTDGVSSRRVADIAALHIDLDQRRVSVGGREVELTAKEFNLLAVLAGEPGRAYSRAELLEMVWGYRYEGYNHTVNSHINRLRGKIENDPAHPELIETVWGYGYRLSDGRSAAAR
ncbi:MAG: response regulator transcription factor [Spirochaeta sp.]|nr:response regulator transcription factor [Spirochaeta sp.]